MRGQKDTNVNRHGLEALKDELMDKRDLSALFWTGAR